MAWEIIKIEPSGFQKLVTVRQTYEPSWLARLFNMKREEVIVQYIGCRTVWRQLPELNELSWLGSTNAWLSDEVQKFETREILRREGKI